MWNFGLFLVEQLADLLQFHCTCGGKREISFQNSSWEGKKSGIITAMWVKFVQCVQKDENSQ